MKKYPFRDHQITRSCETHYRDYHQYLSDLKRDFSNRCCYCNISDKTLGTTPFQIDHFIPKAKFVGTRDELLTQYNNLVLSCPKCNRSKGSQYTGNIHSDTIENSLFYNPDEVDYNTVFYRNECYCSHEMSSDCSDQMTPVCPNICHRSDGKGGFIAFSGKAN